MEGDDERITNTLADQFDDTVGATNDEHLREAINELVDDDDDEQSTAANGQDHDDAADHQFADEHLHNDADGASDTFDPKSSIGGSVSGSTLVTVLSEAAAADADANHDAPDSMLRPLEEFYRQAIMSSSGRFHSKDALLYSKHPQDLLYFGQQLSLYAKKMKAVYNRKRTETTQGPAQYRWANNQVVVIFLNFHQLAVAKFQQIARQDPRKRLAFVCLPENDIPDDKYNTPHDIEASSTVPSALLDLPGMAPTSTFTTTSSSSSSSSSAPSSFTATESSTNFSEAQYPILEVAYSWGLAAFRYGKALQRQHDAEAAHKHFHQAAKLLQYIIEEESSPRTWTVLVFKKLPKVLECITQVRPSDSEIRNYCDAFLIHFSNIAMRGEIDDLCLKPLIALCLSENRYIRACKPVDIVRHLATFFDSKIAAEASRQLSYLETILKRTEDKEHELKRALTAKAKKQLQESGITKEEMMENLDVLLRLINWKGAPPCRLPFEPVPLQEGESDYDLIWLLENPRKFYTDRYKLSLDDDVPNATIYLAKRKTDGAPVAIKVIKKYSLYEESIKKEVEWVKLLRHQVFAHLLDVYLHSDEVWIVLEYCNGGNLVDLLPVSTFTEGMIAYIVREVLKGLEYLHSRNRMHRDLTSDDILMNLDGEVMLVDFEVWLDKSNTRYWLAPELLLSEPFPYGCEVDIWSLGCIIIEMADGRPPYSAFHPLKEFFYTATKGAPTLENPTQWSLHFRNFLAAALRPDPSKRATATELLQHPFIALACTREEFALAVQQRVSFTKW